MKALYDKLEGFRNKYARLFLLTFVFHPLILYINHTYKRSVYNE